MFSIIINGNHLDPATKPAAKASETNYILVQTWARLTPSQRNNLAEEGVEIHDYASKNTYVCGYRGIDLDRICRVDPVVYVEVYRTQLKISSDLRESLLGHDGEIRLSVIFHHGVDQNSAFLQALVVEKSGANPKDILFCPRMAQLVTRGARLEDLAAIDEVRRIEELEDIKLWDDRPG